MLHQYLYAKKKSSQPCIALTKFNYLAQKDGEYSVDNCVWLLTVSPCGPSEYSLCYISLSLTVLLNQCELTRVKCFLMKVFHVCADTYRRQIGTDRCTGVARLLPAVQQCVAASPYSNMKTCLKVNFGKSHDVLYGDFGSVRC